jgi:hypothetical protein
MDQPWPDLLDELRATRFAAIAGAELAFTLPIAESLLTAVIRPRLPASIRRETFELHAEPGNIVRVVFRLVQPAFLPTITVRLRIERQPRLPDDPLIGLRLLSQGFAAIAGSAARLFAALPPGIDISGDIVTVNVARQLEQVRAADLLHYVTGLEVGTLDQRLVLHVQATIPGPAAEPRGQS